eukprot:snap_masked-scaffold_4-processed-gene-20.10-mRNA-1 protein AED:1.00 eAED:1.00 QI:0/0/0/0/1/1/2/0/1065
MKSFYFLIMLISSSCTSLASIFRVKKADESCLTFEFIGYPMEQVQGGVVELKLELYEEFGQSAGVWVFEIDRSQKVNNWTENECILDNPEGVIVGLSCLLQVCNLTSNVKYISSIFLDGTLLGRSLSMETRENGYIKAGAAQYLSSRKDSLFFKFGFSKVGNPDFSKLLFYKKEEHSSLFSLINELDVTFKLHSHYIFVSVSASYTRYSIKIVYDQHVIVVTDPFQTSGEMEDRLYLEAPRLEASGATINKNWISLTIDFSMYAQVTNLNLLPTSIELEHRLNKETLLHSAGRRNFWYKTKRKGLDIVIDCVKSEPQGSSFELTLNLHFDRFADVTASGISIILRSSTSGQIEGKGTSNKLNLSLLSVLKEFESAMFHELDMMTGFMNKVADVSLANSADALFLSDLNIAQPIRFIIQLKSHILFPEWSAKVGSPDTSYLFVDSTDSTKVNVNIRKLQEGTQYEFRQLCNPHSPMTIELYLNETNLEPLRNYVFRTRVRNTYARKVSTWYHLAEPVFSGYLEELHLFKPRILVNLTRPIEKVEHQETLKPFSWHRMDYPNLTHSLLNWQSYTSTKMISTEEQIPGKRRGFSLTRVGNYLVLFGGLTNTPSNDLWTYDLQTLLWRRWEYEGQGIVPSRSYHSGVAFGEFLIISGGLTSEYPCKVPDLALEILDTCEANTLNDIWMFHIPVKKWINVSTNLVKELTMDKKIAEVSFESENDYCLHDALVSVTFEHQCPNHIIIRLRRNDLFEPAYVLINTRDSFDPYLCDYTHFNKTKPFQITFGNRNQKIFLYEKEANLQSLHLLYDFYDKSITGKWIIEFTDLSSTSSLNILEVNVQLLVSPCLAKIKASRLPDLLEPKYLHSSHIFEINTEFVLVLHPGKNKYHVADQTVSFLNMKSLLWNKTSLSSFKVGKVMFSRLGIVNLNHDFSFRSYIKSTDHLTVQLKIFNPVVSRHIVEKEIVLPQTMVPSFETFSKEFASGLEMVTSKELRFYSNVKGILWSMIVEAVDTMEDDETTELTNNVCGEKLKNMSHNLFSTPINYSGLMQISFCYERYLSPKPFYHFIF